MIIPGFPRFLGGEKEPISFVGYNLSESTTVTLPAHQAGDLILICAGGGSSTIPSLAAGYTSLATGYFGSSGAFRIGYKFATSSSETSGTWTPTLFLGCSVYRNVNAVGNVNSLVAVGTQRASWAGLTTSQGPSLVTYFGASSPRAVLSATPGALFLQRARVNALTSYVFVIQETKTPVSSIAQTLDVSTSTGSAWVTTAIELVG